VGRVTDVLLIVLYVSAGIAAAWEARRKGYDDRLFLVLGIALGPLALLLMLLLRQRQLQVGTVVRPAAPIALEDGRRIRPSHVSVVREVAVRDGEVLCRITGPDAAPHWVAQEALTRVRGHAG
jgi:hypothetical protein